MVSSTAALALTVGTLAAFCTLGFRHSRGRGGGVEDFLTACNSVGSGSMTATLVASVMGVWILLSPAEAGAAFGGTAAVSMFVTTASAGLSSTRFDHGRLADAVHRLDDSSADLRRGDD